MVKGAVYGRHTLGEFPQVYRETSGLFLTLVCSGATLRCEWVQPRAMEAVERWRVMEVAGGTPKA